MELGNIRRWTLERFQDVPGNFDVGMMLRRTARRRWVLRFRKSTRRDQNRKDAKTHVVFASNCHQCYFAEGDSAFTIFGGFTGGSATF